MRALLYATAMTLASAAMAQQPTDDLMASLTRCRAVTDQAARLVCYDAAATAIETAREKKEIVILDRAEVKKTRRSLFGFTMPRIKFLEGDGKDEPESEIETMIETVRLLGYGEWVIRTAEGATWQTTEPLQDAPRSGAKVTIRRGSLGSFFLKVERAKAVRAMRVG